MIADAVAFPLQDDRRGKAFHRERRSNGRYTEIEAKPFNTITVRGGRGLLAVLPKGPVNREICPCVRLSKNSFGGVVRGAAAPLTIFVSTGFAGRAGRFRLRRKHYRQFLAKKIAAGELQSVEKPLIGRHRPETALCRFTGKVLRHKA